MNRRSLLKHSFSSLAAATLLATPIRNLLQEKAEALVDDLSRESDHEEYWELVKSQFLFQKGLYYFNNASLGPCPRLVVDATNEFRAMLDGFPSRYMWGGWEEEKEATRAKVARMFAVDKEEIALIHNTTEGMNLIASSMDLKPGDEVILADHEHTSGTIPWKYWQERKGIRLVRPTLPLVPESKEALIAVYRKAITPKTRVISMVHGTNTNGMILPVKEVSAMAHEQGILVAVDGAQAAGTFRINLEQLGCDFYAASAHKFVFSPKGMGIFYAKKESQQHLRPLIVAKGYDDPSIRRLENYNTRNLPELLGLGVAVDYYHLLGPERRENRLYELKHYLRKALEGDQRFRLKTPAPDELSCAIQNVEVVGRKVKEVKTRLFEAHQIDCRAMSSHGLNGLRISLSVFTTKRDVDHLVRALKSF